MSESGPNGITPTKGMINKIEYSEHDSIGDVHFKKVMIVGSTGDQFLGGGFNIPEYDYFAVATPNDTTEVYTFKRGGSSGTTVSTVTIVYASNTKELIASASKED